MKYGIVISRRTNEPMNEGYSLAEVAELAEECNSGEIEIYEATGDLAIGPKLLLDMANRIKELEAKLGS